MVIGRFEPAVGSVLGLGLMMKAAVGEGSAQPFMKEEKEQSDLNPFRREAIGVAGSVTLQQGMAFELAQIVTQLVETIGAAREVEGGEDGLMDLLGRPAADVRAACRRARELPSA